MTTTATYAKLLNNGRTSRLSIEFKSAPKSYTHELFTIGMWETSGTRTMSATMLTDIGVNAAAAVMRALPYVNQLAGLADLLVKKYKLPLECVPAVLTFAAIVNETASMGETIYQHFAETYPALA